MKKLKGFFKMPDWKGFLSFWQNIKIGHKYLTAFIISSILFLTAGTIVFFQLSIAEKGIEQIELESIHANEMAQLATLIQEKDGQFADYILTNSQANIDEFENVRKQFDELIDELESSISVGEQSTIFDRIKRDDGRINEMFGDIVNLDGSDEFRASTIRGRSNVLRVGTVGLVNDLIDIVHNDQAEAVARAKTNMDNSIYTLIVASILAVVIGSAFIFLISRNITRNLNKVVDITSEVASGNLAAESMNYEGRDEIGQLASAVNQMKDNIQDILLKVTDASESVSSSSEELTQSANEVKEGSEQVAMTMEEISSGAETQANSASDLAERMNNFVELVQTSEQYGQEVATTSNDVIKFTTEGSTLMEDAVGQMQRIDLIVSEAVEQVQGLDRQSDEISQLVRVIQDVADQTNLLALNAAIEAARAGEHGRGFAVVADEVRKLAEQVASSVSEITGIVNNIQSETDHVVESLNEGYGEVKEGTEQMERTGRNFVIIDESVADMVTKILSISANLKNIADSSHQMNNLIEDIASVSEESAAGVEQAAASSQQSSSSMDEVSSNADELAKLAEQLNAEVRVFTL